ncbi:unnamed protein product [Boreogadus saida]
MCPSEAALWTALITEHRPPLELEVLRCEESAPHTPLSCSMKHTFPWALKASVSGVMHRLWKSWVGWMLRKANTL